MTDLQVLQAQADAAQASYEHAALVLCSLVAFELAFVAGVAVHEFGHAVMARRAGLSVRMVRIGTGWPLLRLRFGSAWVVVRALPFSGAVLALVPRSPGRGAASGFLLGGMGANAAVLAAAALAWALDPGAWWPLPVALAQATLLFITAVPYTWYGRQGPERSDGERLRCLWRGEELWSSGRAQAGLARRLGLDDPLPPPSPWWPEIAYQVTRREQVWEAWARRDAGTVLRDMLDRPDLTWFERLVVQDELVMQEAVHGEGVLTEAALARLSAATLAEADTAPIRIARGGALCRLGRWDEAEAMIGSHDAGAAGSRAAYARLFSARIKLGRARVRPDASRTGGSQPASPTTPASGGNSRTS